MTIVLLFRRCRTTLYGSLRNCTGSICPNHADVCERCAHVKGLLAPVLTYRDCTGTDWQEGVWITNLALEVISGLLLVVFLWVSAGEATELAGLKRKAT